MFGSLLPYVFKYPFRIHPTLFDMLWLIDLSVGDDVLRHFSSIFWIVIV
jgi:hypothetical protein